jgi:hypothetical protein
MVDSPMFDDSERTEYRISGVRREEWLTAQNLLLFEAPEICLGHRLQNQSGRAGIVTQLFVALSRGL